MVLAGRKLTIIIFCTVLAATVSLAWTATCRFDCCLECNKAGPKPVLTDAKGNVSFQLDEAKRELRYTLQVEKLRDSYMAHLHIGSSDKEGAIAAWHYSLHNHAAPNRLVKGEFNGTLVEGVIRPADLKDGITFDDLVNSMRTGKAYVNVHTKKYVRGEIRDRIVYDI